MKVSSIDKSTSSAYNSPVVKSERGKEFSDTMQSAHKDQQEQALKEMLNRIKSAGDRLKASKNVPDILDYKKRIQEYLSFVTKNFYSVQRDRRYNGDMLLRVEVIDKEVDELTQALLAEEKGNVALADKIDKIRGLILDLFC